MVLEWYEPTKLACGCTTTAYLWQELDNAGNPVGLPEYRVFIRRRLPHCKHWWWYSHVVVPRGTFVPHKLGVLVREKKRDGIRMV